VTSFENSPCDQWKEGYGIGDIFRGVCNWRIGVPHGSGAESSSAPPVHRAANTDNYWSVCAIPKLFTVSTVLLFIRRCCCVPNASRSPSGRAPKAGDAPIFQDKASH
jgi:hypothetical protein